MLQAEEAEEEPPDVVLYRLFVDLEEEILRKTGMRPRHRIPPVRKQQAQVGLTNQIAAGPGRANQSDSKN